MRRATKRATAKTTEAPIPAGAADPIAEHRKAIEAAQALQSERFIHAYQALCQEHGFHLEVEIRIRPGALPEGILTAVPNGS